MHKILVLDDDPDILEVVRLILTKHGLDVKTLSNWKAFWHVAREFQPSLILMDVDLGTADGQHICRILKEDSTTRNIPVILFSAIADLQDSFISCQAQAFIEKPFDVHHLLAMIRANLKTLT